MKRFGPRIAPTSISAIRAIIIAIFSLSAASNAAGGQLYGIEYDTGNLYQISTANAALSLVGNTGASLLGSLEYRPANGFLYGIGSDPLNTGNGNGLLYRINPANASTTLVGSIGPEHVFEGGLVIAPDGTAYATNMNFNDNLALFKINLDTAATTMVGIISGGGHDINGLAWRSDNMLVGLDRVTDSLLAINPSTAASSVIAAVSAPIGGVGGMAAIGDSGYIATGNFNGSNSLFSFNLNSGAHTLIGSFSPTIAGVGISGLALVVPEPASLTLAALAIVPLLMMRRRLQTKTRLALGELRHATGGRRFSSADPPVRPLRHSDFRSARTFLSIGKRVALAWDRRLCGIFALCVADSLNRVGPEPIRGARKDSSKSPIASVSTLILLFLHIVTQRYGHVEFLPPLAGRGLCRAENSPCYHASPRAHPASSPPIFRFVF